MKTESLAAVTMVTLDLDNFDTIIARTLSPFEAQIEGYFGVLEAG